MIRVEGATLTAGGDTLLEGASWHVRPGEHVGLVGRNGTGKSTLLRAIVGEVGLDRGTITCRSGARLGWLPQQAVSGSSRPVWDEVASRMAWFHDLKAALDAAQEAADAGRADGVSRLADATEAFRAGGGFAVDAAIGEVLHGLGFGPDRWRQPCDTFSGGWQMRIALARLLLSRPDVALLDEPTNHLDLEARSWLAGFLAKAPWTLVIVSHDRWLLERAVGRIAEIRSGRLHHYVGNFSAFVRERESRRVEQSGLYARQQAEIGRLERFVERFGAKATKAAQAKSKQKAIDRIERVDAPDADEGGPRFRLPEAPPCERVAIALRGAAAGWGEGAVFTGVDLELERGMRLAVLGPNGAGKSTLLHALSGRLPLKAGRRLLADRVRFGVFSQDLAAELPAEQTALAWLTTLAPLVPPQRIRGVLGALGLSGDDALRPMGGLSGGEKARVALTALAVRPHNALLLDEPTNHLDAESVDALVGALAAFEGALLLITHDRWLVERLATHVCRVEHGAVTFRIGVRPDDFERAPPPSETGAPAPAASIDHAARRKRDRERERAARRIAALQAEIEADEQAIAALDERMYTEFARAAELATERRALKTKVDTLYAEWEALEADAVGPG